VRTLVWLLLAATSACSRRPTGATESAPATPSVSTAATPAPAAKEATEQVRADASPPPPIGPLPPLEVQEVEATGQNPKGVVLSHDGKRLYVTNFGQLDHKRVVSIYDAETLGPLGELDLPAVVVEAAISPDDRTLYLSSFWGHSVLFVDVETKAIAHEIKVGNHPKIVALTPDGQTLFAANWSGESVSEIDVGRAELVRTHKVGKNPRGLAVSSKGTLYAANFYGESIDVFEGPDRERHHRISVCRCPRHLALSPDEKTLYVSCLFGSQLHAIDLTSEAVTHRAQLGSSPKSIAVSGDGRYVYSADYGTTRSVSVVDTSDWTTRSFGVPGMDRGSGVVASADGRHAFVTGWYDAHIYRVGFEGSGGHPESARAKIARWLHKPFSRDPGDGQ
jgi:DNA-binding beta-propeller fold protein YncE